MPLNLARIPYFNFSFKDGSMSNNNLNDEGFKVVTYKKKRPKTIEEINCETLVQPVASEWFDLDTAVKRVKAAKEDLATADVYSSILASLREGLDILHKPKVKEIICFGLGKIGECMIARYQLALLLCLRDLYQVQAFVYDPIFNENEHRILSAFDVNVLHNNNEGKYRVKEKSTTLFYLPHCPKQLTNNLLWANWGLQLSYCVIIANSFTKIIESNSKRHITENAGYILNASSYVTELAVVNSFKYYEIFNDTAIHIFPWDDISLISQDFWQYNAEPKYSSNDIEFISNKLSSDLKLYRRFSDSYKSKMNFSPSLRTLRQITHELRRTSSQGNLKDSLILRYIFDQYRKFKTTEQQVCKAEEEMNFVANSYLCYLRSSRMRQEIHNEFHGKGERSIKETADLVGFKLPNDPK